MQKAANFILYYLAWFACVLSLQAQQRWWWSALAVAGVVSWHLWQSRQRRRDGVTLLLATLLGPLVDVVLLASGLLVLPASAGQVHPVVPPLAMWLLWPAFATTFYSSLSWLVARPLWLSGCAFCGGPLAYLAAQAMVEGIVLAPDLTTALLSIGVIWALALPLLVALCRAGTCLTIRAHS
ncbi:MAG: hypothetical protein CMK83_15770 [Pseudomonadales bacterium]|jgi:hypothetical protein|uniref:DUF2878 domain-containing protein n=1 Tax=unclassified Ketobacter TaxID=2639109 RepID=UPI000C562BE8|nr:MULTISPECIES: DUF2878 domain-containing protein [unclassified Ketobacter]MAA58840.1 hypothetical protein [Pseudomonadales bacterium]MEC8809778.1 DUF2878 domain-containing protein [Pseudomonadota bacterium]HAG95772.1 hypothetical protein [Gammaproteobacteria bacterium]MAQ25664.1 hypothetical protein [Pseudomonadales bacterium]MBI25634.1 hypothetical protein [Pseudomonadales bacterium]|tara:strand:+ start:3294 stop:3836 length:543 start_codon:yes stop_codon:yes gene_type:complete